MTEPTNNDIAVQFAAKYGAGIAGALLSLRFQPRDATLGDRIWAVIGGLATVLWGVPAVVEILDVAKPGIVGLMGFLGGVLGMTVLSELSATMRSAGLGAIVAEGVREWARRLFGIRGGDKGDKGGRR